jgi:hypothetical protein
VLLELGRQPESLSLVVLAAIGAPELIAAIRGRADKRHEERVAGLEAPRGPKRLDRELGVTANPSHRSRRRRHP